jgi:hypothetical protein
VREMSPSTALLQRVSRSRARVSKSTAFQYFLRKLHSLVFREQRPFSIQIASRVSVLILFLVRALNE